MGQNNTIIYGGLAIGPADGERYVLGVYAGKPTKWLRRQLNNVLTSKKSMLVFPYKILEI